MEPVDAADPTTGQPVAVAEATPTTTPAAVDDATPTTTPAAVAEATPTTTTAAAAAAEAKRKGIITEDEVSMLFNRYHPTAILTFLQEVYQFAGAKIDWNALVKQTTSGITSPRECQMLWRHLAYRHFLLPKIEGGAEPLDDDSDLEFDLEALPAASDEALFEAISCVETLMHSGLTWEPGLIHRTLEVPLTTKADDHTCDNLTHTAAADKQTPPSGNTAEGLNRNTSAGDNSLVSDVGIKMLEEEVKGADEMELDMDQHKQVYALNLDACADKNEISKSACDAPEATDNAPGSCSQSL